MTGLELRHWAHSWDFTHGEAATALGIGRSSFCKYIKQLRVPEFVRLAVARHEGTFYTAAVGMGHHQCR